MFVSCLDYQDFLFCFVVLFCLDYPHISFDMSGIIQRCYLCLDYPKMCFVLFCLDFVYIIQTFVLF